MRWQLGQRLGEIEIVGELLALGLLAVAHLGGHARVGPHLLAQGADEVGILVEALDQNGAGAVERGGGIRNALLGVDETFCHDLRIVAGFGQQLIGERLETGFLGDLCLGAALRLERQVNVFEACLAVGGHDRGFEGCIELALLADRFENGLAAVFELAQVNQALLQGAQLRVVERTGRFLAVAGDEGNRGAAVEQRHRRLDLLGANPKLLRNFVVDICHARFPLSKHATQGEKHRPRDAAYGPTEVDSSRWGAQPSTEDFLSDRCDLATFVGTRDFSLASRQTRITGPSSGLTGVAVQRLFAPPGP
ncbi:hypothetical protein ABIG06_003981 [Bradyrhizobium sp. USDA 326]